MTNTRHQRATMPQRYSIGDDSRKTSLRTLADEAIAVGTVVVDPLPVGADIRAILDAWVVGLARAPVLVTTIHRRATSTPLPELIAAAVPEPNVLGSEVRGADVHEAGGAERGGRC